MARHIEIEVFEPSHFERRIADLVPQEDGTERADLVTEWGPLVVTLGPAPAPVVAEASVETEEPVEATEQPVVPPEPTSVAAESEPTLDQHASAGVQEVEGDTNEPFLDFLDEPAPGAEPKKK